MKHLAFAFVIALFLISLRYSNLFNEQVGWFLSFTITTYTSVTWVVALGFFYDFLMGIVGRNSNYMIEYHSEHKWEIFNSLIVTGLLVYVFLASPQPYSHSSIDIAAFGLPFLIG